MNRFTLGEGVMKKIGLRDVARCAGVSVGTVSKYLNNTPISEINRCKIKETIEELKYVPNINARKLAIGKSLTILIYIIVEEVISDSTWLHELPIIQGINDVLRKTEYKIELEIASITQSSNNFLNLSENIQSCNFDGIIIISSWETDEKIREQLQSINFPHIIIGNLDEETAKNTIDFDNYEPIAKITQAIIDKGRKNFSMIAGYQEQYHTKMRVKGFVDTLKKNQLEAESLFYSDYSMESGEFFAKKILEKSPKTDAIICGNDYIAVGVYKALKEVNMTPSIDVSICGFDDSFVSKVVDPLLTTVKINSYGIGTLAASELLKQLSNSDYITKNTFVESQVVWRSST